MIIVLYIHKLKLALCMYVCVGEIRNSVSLYLLACITEQTDISRKLKKRRHLLGFKFLSLSLVPSLYFHFFLSCSQTTYGSFFSPQLPYVLKGNCWTSFGFLFFYATCLPHMLYCSQTLVRCKIIRGGVCLGTIADWLIYSGNWVPYIIKKKLILAG